jgi:hypothetical protein
VGSTGQLGDPLLAAVIEEILPKLLRARLGGKTHASADSGLPSSLDSLYTTTVADVYRLLFLSLAREKGGSAGGDLPSEVRTLFEKETGRLCALLRSGCSRDAPPWGRLHEGLREWEVRMVGDGDSSSRGGEAHARPSVRVMVSHGTELVRRSVQRRGDGCYSTPAAVVRWIVEQTVGPVVEERLEGLEAALERRDRALPHGRAAGRLGARDAGEVSRLADAAVRSLFSLSVCDPALGDGRFLVETSRYLVDRIVEFLETRGDPRLERAVRRLWKEERARDRAHEVDREGGDGRAAAVDLRTVVRHLITERSLFGIDTDRAGVTLAERALWLEVLPASLPLPRLRSHLRCADALLGPRLGRAQHEPEGGDGSSVPGGGTPLGAPGHADGRAGSGTDEDLVRFDWVRAFPEIFPQGGSEEGALQAGSGGFDAVVGNPPFESCDTLARVRPALAGAYKRLFAEVVPPGSKPDIYFFFVARAIEALRPGGYMGLVVPNRILAGDAARWLRQAIFERRIVTVRELDTRRTFPDADVMPVVLVLRREAPAAGTTYVSQREESGPRRGDSKRSPGRKRRERTTLIPQETAERLGIVVTGLDGKALAVLRRVQDGKGYRPAEELFRVREGLRGPTIDTGSYARLSRKAREDYLPLFRGSEIDRYRYLGPSGYFHWPREERMRAGQALRRTNKTRQLEPKVAIAELGERIECCRADGVAYGGVYFVSGSDLAGPVTLDLLCALLNSRLMTALCRLLFGATAWHGALKFRSCSLGALAVPAAPPIAPADPLRKIKGRILGIARRGAEHPGERRLDELRAAVRFHPPSCTALLEELAGEMLALGERCGRGNVHGAMVKLDRIIDEIVYAWYGLSREEARTVERIVPPWEGPRSAARQRRRERQGCCRDPRSRERDDIPAAAE